MTDNKTPVDVHDDEPGWDTDSEIEMMKYIRKKMLIHWKKLLDSGEITSTDLATITRLAVQNGWVLDETRLPSRLKDKLLTHHDPSVLDDDDGVIPIRAAGGKKNR